MEVAKKAAASMAALALVACSASARPAPPAQTPEEPAAAWPMYRGDLVRDGHPAGATLPVELAGGLGLAWRIRLGGAIDGTPAVANGVVFAGSAGGTFGAFDLRSGRTIWTRQGLGTISASPTIEGADVLVAGQTGAVSLLIASDGATVWTWRAPAGAAIWSSPAVYRDVAVIGVASPYGDTPLVAGRLVGLDLRSGSERWSFCILQGCRPGDGVWSTPSIDAAGEAYIGVGNPDDAVLGFDALTGERRWMTGLYPDAGRDLDVGAAPVLFSSDGREFVGEATVEGTFAVLDARTGKVVWSRKLVEGTAVHGLIASPAFDGDNFYAGSASPPYGLLALRASDGAVLWRDQTDLPVYSAPALGFRDVVFGTGAVFGDTAAGAVIAVSTSDGSEVWRYDTRSAVRDGPAIVGDDVVAGDSAGDLFAFRLSVS